MDSVTQVDGVSEMASACQLCGGRAQKGTMASAAFLSGRKLSPSSCLDARHFSSSLYATGAFQAVASLLELRVSKSD